MLDERDQLLTVPQGRFVGVTEHSVAFELYEAHGRCQALADVRGQLMDDLVRVVELRGGQERGVAGYVRQQQITTARPAISAHVAPIGTPKRRAALVPARSSPSFVRDPASRRYRATVGLRTIGTSGRRCSGGTQACLDVPIGSRGGLELRHDAVDRPAAALVPDPSDRRSDYGDLPRRPYRRS